MLNTDYFPKDLGRRLTFALGIGAALMCAAGIVAAFLAVNAEQRSLEDIAKPLSQTDGDDGGGHRRGFSRGPVHGCRPTRRRRRCTRPPGRP